MFLAYRDRLPELTAYLPNIQRITVLDRTTEGDVVKLVNEWVGGGDIPKVAQSVLKESMLRWTDYASWHPTSFTVDWRTEVHAAKEAVACSGQNRFVDLGGETRLEIRGALTCDSAKLPGVPRLLAKTINAAVEKVLVGQIQVNLVEVGKGVGRLLQASAGAS